jgi:leucyl-tRNA synthetase
MGHVRNYTMGDVLARYRRMQGREVLHPMGWDAFGMPAENAAMERKVHPGEWTRANIATMREQLKRLGFALDWDRELATCDPEYYGHEQRCSSIFSRPAGLPQGKRGQLGPGGLHGSCERAGHRRQRLAVGAPVERRRLYQWFLKITDFAEDLLQGLGELDKWPDKVRLMQENWIGKSRGLQFRFRLAKRAPGPTGSMFSLHGLIPSLAQALWRSPRAIPSPRRWPPVIPG